MNLAAEQIDEITNELQHLIGVSSRLREAMLTRDAERIQAIVEEQNGLRPSAALLTATPDTLNDQEVGRLAQRLQRLQESNRLLASTFSKLYRNMLQPRSVTGGAGGQAYGRLGQAESAGSNSLLIQQTG